MLRRGGGDRGASDALADDAAGIEDGRAGELPARLHVLLDLVLRLVKLAGYLLDQVFEVLGGRKADFLELVEVLRFHAGFGRMFLGKIVCGFPSQLLDVAGHAGDANQTLRNADAAGLGKPSSRNRVSFRIRIPIVGRCRNRLPGIGIQDDFSRRATGGRYGRGWPRRELRGFGESIPGIASWHKPLACR